MKSSICNGKLEFANQTAIGLIGVGIGFVLLPVLLGIFISNILVQLLNTISVGIVYICMGIAIGGWQQRTQSNQIPFWIVGSTAVVAILSLIGLELFILRLPVSPVSDSSYGIYPVLQQVVLSPHLLLGVTVALVIVTDSAKTLRQRVLGMASIAVVPLLVTVVSIQYTFVYLTVEKGYTASEANRAADSTGIFVFPFCLFILLVGGVYTLPYFLCKSPTHNYMKYIMNAD